MVTETWEHARAIAWRQTADRRVATTEMAASLIQQWGIVTTWNGETTVS